MLSERKALVAASSLGRAFYRPYAVDMEFGNGKSQAARSPKDGTRSDMYLQVYYPTAICPGSGHDWTRQGSSSFPQCAAIATPLVKSAIEVES